MQSAILILGGLAALIAGAELLVRGGTALAIRLGVSPLIIGLTVVSLGTSTPELAIGIDAASQGKGSLAVANIAGTNTVNILLILGLSAAICPLPLKRQTLQQELPAIVIASLALWLFAANGTLSNYEGAALLAMGALFTLLIIRAARHESLAVNLEYAHAVGRHRLVDREAATEVALLGSGIIILVVGADLLVDGAIDLARRWQVSETVIGLTIVAIGTSAPELVTTVLSTFKNQRDIAIGNLIGSSAYNILVILGMTCLVAEEGVEVGSYLIGVDIPIMVGVALLCIPVFLSGKRISRAEGILFISAYAIYLAYLIALRT